MRTLYLAGPEVFLADAAAIGARKKALCAEAGFEGLFPLDQVVPGGAPREVGMAIWRGNRAMMARADGIIANLSPFRGPGADGGTVLELGLMAGLGRGLFGYTHDVREYGERVLAGSRQGSALAVTPPPTPPARGGGKILDTDGLEVEAFGMADNLMIEGVLGGSLVRVAAEDPWRSMEGFERCLALARAHLG